MLYFNSNYPCNSSAFSLFNRSFIFSLTPQQKRITLVMLSVFGCFAVGYMIYRHLCRKAKQALFNDPSRNIALKQEIFQSALPHPMSVSSVASQSVATPSTTAILPKETHQTLIKEQTASQIPSVTIVSKKTESLHILDYPQHIAISEHEWKAIAAKINHIFSTDAILRTSTAFAHSLGMVVLWKSGDAVLLTRDVIGRGLTKTVYTVIDLRTGKNYAGALIDNRAECETQSWLKGKRGIAQLINYTFVICNGIEKHFFYGERYDTDLSAAIEWCTEGDFKVIVKDLLYSIIALEGDDPKGEWIDHGDLKDANIYLKIDAHTQQVLGAYLGDFGFATKQVTHEINEEKAKAEMKRLRCVITPWRETQRKDFVVKVFHQIKDRLDCISQTSLLELCSDDPICERMMEALFSKYGYIFERPYFHWRD